jgi:hypothetical protein
MALSAEDLEVFRAVLDRVEEEFAALFAAGFILDSPSRLRALHQYFAALLGRAPVPPVRCNVSRYSAVIEVDGRLRPCFFLPAYGGSGRSADMEHSPPGAGLAAALNRPESRAFRAAIRRGARPECGRCVCPLYRSPAAVLLGRG